MELRQLLLSLCHIPNHPNCHPEVLEEFVPQGSLRHSEVDFPPPSSSVHLHILLLGTVP